MNQKIKLIKYSVGICNFLEIYFSYSDIYPKWLIEVEKKRAEAELTRAKAEEQRAGIAAKTAEAAVTQAEALKKLSEAATVQAEALMRIAVMLENRNHQDLLPI